MLLTWEGFIKQPESQSAGRIDVIVNVKEPNFKGWREKAIYILRLSLLRNLGLWIL